MKGFQSGLRPFEQEQILRDQSAEPQFYEKNTVEATVSNLELNF